MRDEKRIFALGFFDGVHLGHQALLRACVALAKEADCETAAITFGRHPMSLFTEAPPLINTAWDRVDLLHRYGIAEIHTLPVTNEVMSTRWQDFLLDLMKKGAAGFVCGEDFRFGHRGEGDAKKLAAFCEERGLPCVIVPEQLMDGLRVSSTHIRALLENGNVEEANRFLGHPHVLSGPVISGRQLGRTIGVPTANLRLPNSVLTPRLGVYACRACFDDERYMAVTNVGTRPTVDGHHITVEPWILDFDGDLYGKTITLEFHAFLRPERKFDSLAALKAAIEENARQTREYFKEREPWKT